VAVESPEVDKVTSVYVKTRDYMAKDCKPVQLPEIQVIDAPKRSADH
jgi:hypothetical protein